MRPLAFCALALSLACKGDAGASSDDGQDTQADTATQASAEAQGTEPTTDSPDAGEAGTGMDGSEGAGAVCPKLEGETITLTTQDGVDLIADHYTVGGTGSRLALLLHMIPPSNDKSNYPPEFIEALRSAGYDVLNVNRRGAPGSGGLALDAYTGDAGKFDAMAGVAHALGHECKPDPTRLLVVGASNGTTTALDYAVHAASANNPRLVPTPARLIFLSGGAYTENQNSIADQLAAVADTPIFFAYPSAESAWNLGVQDLAGAGESWTFQEFSPGDHGSRLFASNPELVAQLVDWVGP